MYFQRRFETKQKMTKCDVFTEHQRQKEQKEYSPEPKNNQIKLKYPVFNLVIFLRATF